MKKEELIKYLSARFYPDFANTIAMKVCEGDALHLLYQTVTSPNAELPRSVRHKVLFRGAYVLEKIYFGFPEVFLPFADPFCRCDFSACSDASARRHFAKIMADLLGYYKPDAESLERIAEAAAQWAVDTRAKVAVRIWAVEVLKHCRTRVDWVADIWDDIVETLSYDATPGIDVRMRKSWKTSGNI
ncbi:hypothetical protein [uncultured Alistipes sp.]|uniref:hypothetical protein n=1 Tax=uncultured Alistipes sp. TaxID=538949 RepID=UPI0025D3B76C|nr:hypothetical protein [uncultured Alistipes sp.]